MKAIKRNMINAHVDPLQILLLLHGTLFIDYFLTSQCLYSQIQLVTILGCFNSCISLENPSGLRY